MGSCNQLNQAGVISELIGIKEISFNIATCILKGKDDRDVRKLVLG